MNEQQNDDSNSSIHTTYYYFKISLHQNTSNIDLIAILDMILVHNENNVHFADPSRTEIREH